MRWHSSDAFEKRQKKKLFGENNFLHLAFLAPGENYCESAKKSSFHLKNTPPERILWDDFNTGSPFSTPPLFPSCCLLMGAFSFLLWFILISTIFLFTFFLFISFRFFFFAPCDDDVSHTSARLRLSKHTLPLCFFIPSELLACATNFAPFGRRPIIGRISVCMLVPARRCYATSNTRSIIKHENSPLLRLSDRSSHMHVEEAKKYLHTVQSLTSIHSSWTRRVVASVENK